jgi:hypothetical protein
MICFSTPHMNLTVNRQSGAVPISLIAFASHGVTEPIPLDAAITGAPATSAVKLTSGQMGTKAHLTVSFSKPIQEASLLRVETSADNPKSGLLFYSIYAGTPAKVKVRGVPMQITVKVP